MLRLILATATLALVWPIWAQNCPAPQSNRRLYRVGKNEVVLFTWAPNSEDLTTIREPLESDLPVLQRHERWVRSFTSTEPKDLLLRAEKIRRLVRPNSYTYFIEKYGSSIHPIACLDGFLYARHERNFPNASKPDDAPEVEAFVLERSRPANGSREFAVIYASAYDPSLGTVAPSSIPEIKNTMLRQLESLLRQGYRYRAHFHSHPFMPKNPTGDIAGIVTPSGCSGYADLWVYLNERKAHALEEAWVTNGIHTWKASVRSDDGTFTRLLQMRDRENQCKPFQAGER